MSQLIIFGNTEVAQLAHYYFSNDSTFEVVAFTVNEEYIKEDSFEGKPLVPFENIQEIYSPESHYLFVAMGYTKVNLVREQKFVEAQNKGYKLASYISSKCSFLSNESVGDNCFILEDNTIQPFVKIGDNVTLWSGNHIGHHSIIESHSFITSHVVVSGNCKVGDHSFLGVNSTIADGVQIAKKNIIGAGAVVTKNTSDSQVIVPARSVVLDKSSENISL